MGAFVVFDVEIGDLARYQGFITAVKPALAAAGAIEMTLDLNAPFRGLIRISSKPMKDALDEISRT